MTFDLIGRLWALYTYSALSSVVIFTPETCLKQHGGLLKNVFGVADLL